MKVLGLDCETTGLDSNKDVVIEIGAVVFDSKTWNVLDTFECLVYEDWYPKSSKEAQAAHKIPLKVLQSSGMSFAQALCLLLKKAPECDFVMAHHAPFDFGMLAGQANRMGIENVPLFKMPWVCSKNDIPHPPSMKSRSLRHLALDYGIMVDPAQLHRALSDVLLMGQMLKAIGVDGKYYLEHWKLPEYLIEAETKYEERQHPKALGYSWSPEDKKWTKRIKQTSLEIEKTKANFKINIKKVIHES